MDALLNYRISKMTGEYIKGQFRKKFTIWASEKKGEEHEQWSAHNHFDRGEIVCFINDCLLLT